MKTAAVQLLHKRTQLMACPVHGLEGVSIEFTLEYERIIARFAIVAGPEGVCFLPPIWGRKAFAL